MWLRTLAGRIGRRFWLDRVSRALDRAHDEGLIDLWTWRQINHRITYPQDGAAYPARPKRAQ